MKNLFIGTAALALLAIPAAASADSVEYWSNDWWYVADNTSREGGPACALATEDVGIGDRASLLSVLHYDGNSVFMFVQNKDWTITKDRKYENIDITFFDARGEISASFNGADWTGTNRDTMGVNNDSSILDYYAKSQNATMFRVENNDDITVIGRINLNGSAQAVSKLRECFVRAKARYDTDVARERISPRNPFG